MVKRRLILAVLLVIVASTAITDKVISQTQYHLGREWTQIWINTDGSIDLLYNMSVACDSGTINYVNVGQPNNDFHIGYAQDEAGNNLSATDTGDSRVRVYLPTSISSGETFQFSLITNVGRMVFENPQNASFVDMEFTPTWYDAVISDLRVLIVLPSGVLQQEVGTNVNWDNSEIVDGRFAVYWQRTDLPPNQKYDFGVTFPKKYVEKYEQQPSGLAAFIQKYGLVLVVFGTLVAVIAAIIIVVRKRPYIIPRISMETLGIRHGLTAVEASYLLEFKPERIVTEILYSLLHKRALWVESTTPSLKLMIMKPFENKTGTEETHLRYYEIDFLEALKDDGMLDEEKLAHAVINLEDTVEEKMRGYCRRDTVEYYGTVVAKAWLQVEQAGTLELASKAYDEQLLWLLLDPDYKGKTQTAFRDGVFEPSPLWLWYWYGYRHYNPNPTYNPNIEVPTQAAKPPAIPGADFANNIATAVERTSTNIVSNVEKFANAIVAAPPSARASHEPASHGADCVCACAACACACACVSCACACASGGVG